MFRDCGGWPSRCVEETMRKLAFTALLLLLGLAANAADLRAAELLMFEDASCGWCRRWHADVGQGYPHSEEGRRAPLRRLHIRDQDSAGVSLARPVQATPTFVLVDGGPRGRPHRRPSRRRLLLSAGSPSCWAGCRPRRRSRKREARRCARPCASAACADSPAILDADQVKCRGSASRRRGARDAASAIAGAPPRCGRRAAGRRPGRTR